MVGQEEKEEGQEEGKRPPGRPPSYDPQYHPEVGRKLCLLGLTEEEMAKQFGKTPQTIINWKKKYPEFDHALQRGKEGADARVAVSMYERACGYSHPDHHVSVHKVKEIRIDGETGEKVIEEKLQPVILPITKHYPPDVGAGVFWLINRTRKTDHAWVNARSVEHTGQGGGPIQTEDITTPIDLSDCTDEELDLAEKIGLAAAARKRSKKKREPLF